MSDETEQDVGIASSLLLSPVRSPAPLALDEHEAVALAHASTRRLFEQFAPERWPRLSLELMRRLMPDPETSETQ